MFGRWILRKEVAEQRVHRRVLLEQVLRCDEEHFGCHRKELIDGLGAVRIEQGVLASIDRKKSAGKHTQSVSSIKRSGQARRNTPSQSESDSLQLDLKTFEDPVTLEHEKKLKAMRTPELSQASLPKVAKSDSKANVSLNLKLRYLDKKNFAGKYQEAVIQEEYNKRNASQDSYTKKYNSVMNNLRV